MYCDARIAVVLPCHNEAGFIGGVLAGLPEFVDRIVVVDDTSTDATADRAAEVASGDPRVEVLRNEANLGVGGSMVRGMRHLLETGERPDVIVKVDGDGQMPLERMPALLDAVLVEGADYAKGNRFLVPDELDTMPKERLLGNSVASVLSKLVTGYHHVGDPQNGFTAVRTAALARIDLDGLHPRFFFENDMLVRLNAAGAKVLDVPSPAIYGAEHSDIDPVRMVASQAKRLTGALLWRLWHKHVLRDGGMPRRAAAGGPA